MSKVLVDFEPIVEAFSADYTPNLAKMHHYVESMSYSYPMYRIVADSPFMVHVDGSICDGAVINPSFMLRSELTDHGVLGTELWVISYCLHHDYHTQYELETLEGYAFQLFPKIRSVANAHEMELVRTLRRTGRLQ